MSISPTSFPPTQRFEGTDLAQLLSVARAATCPEERTDLEDEIVRRHLHLTERMARRYRGRGADLDDLVAVANLALLKAIRGFEARRGEFEHYAQRTISGELKKHFRDHCWIIRPPRRVQDLQREIARLRSDQACAREELTSERLAELLDADPDLVVEAMSLRDHYTARSLDQPFGDPSGPALQAVVADPVDELSRWEAMVELQEALGVLDDRDRELLELRFVLELTQDEIGRRVGVSQVQVSRRLRQVLDRVRSGEQGRSLTTGRG